ncbi:hypothetical protein GQ44DRAFT_624358 [Phaeosphaeriaceae sp. PMI808]|nr:hypothetical protein GQ44DRAFT_624358 [Phaeosphaeriaceae sp. PMI808]
MSYQYLISRRLDPVFAVSIGLAAAVTRVQREEREKGRGRGESFEALKRRWSLAWREGWTGKV